jgi:hypothetical protein
LPPFAFCSDPTFALPPLCLTCVALRLAHCQRYQNHLAIITASCTIRNTKAP